MKRKRKQTVWIMGLVLAAATAVRANNLTISNVTVRARDHTTAYVQFDIRWENSWRYTNVNHDAAWVFFNVLPDGQTTAQPVTLEGTGTNPQGYAVGTGTAIEMIVPPDRMGLFVRRLNEGAGTTSVQGISAVWNFASNSLTRADKVKLQAFGVEMVFVAEGSFKVGSGGKEVGSFTEGNAATTWKSGTTPSVPFAITSEAAITISNAVGCLWGTSSSGVSTIGGNGVLSSAFPKGFAAFYCMKYEITQGQHTDFLNTLTRHQQEKRCYNTSMDKPYSEQDRSRTAPPYMRNTVKLTTDPGSPLPRVYTTTRPDRAGNLMSPAEVCAILDWARLRPMTELEFEKACRGPMTPVVNEFAWGNATIMSSAPLTIIGSEDGTETLADDTAAGGCYYGGEQGLKGDDGDGGYGALRAGIFATSGSTRAAAGASYWGIMELSGSINEKVVAVGTADGRSFTGLHGNGVLTVDGNADVANWMAGSTTLVGFRGGRWSVTTPFAEGRVSDRTNGTTPDVGRRGTSGGRGVRTAPSGVGP